MISLTLETAIEVR